MDDKLASRPSRPVMDITARRPVQPPVRRAVSAVPPAEPVPPATDSMEPDQTVVPQPPPSPDTLPAATTAVADQADHDDGSATNQESKQTSPVMPPAPRKPWLAIVVALAVSAALIILAVMAYLDSREAVPPAPETLNAPDQTIDSATQAIDEAINSLEVAPDPDSDPLSDSTLDDATLGL